LGSSFLANAVPSSDPVLTSVADPDPDLLDPHVFGPPPGSGFTSQRYESESDPDSFIIIQK